jgi:hypothetical protein
VKGSALALMLLLPLLIPTWVTMPIVKVARANFVPAADIYITAPGNKTYSSSLLMLNYTAYFTITRNEFVVYSIDGGDNVTILERQSSEFYETICKQVSLPELPDGSHNLAVYAIYPERSGVSSSAKVYFTVDTTPPTISNLSVENRTYDSTNLTLTFNLDETARQISYSLDNQANTTLTGNSTLTGLAEGSHTLNVYAEDEAGNTAIFGPVRFNVWLPKPASETVTKPDCFPLIAVSVVVAAVVAVAAVVYLKKRSVPKMEHAVP